MALPELDFGGNPDIRKLQEYPNPGFLDRDNFFIVHGS